MITPGQRKALDKAIRRRVKSEGEYLWRGAGHPEDIDGIEAEWRDSKRCLKWMLDDLTVKEKK